MVSTKPLVIVLFFMNIFGNHGNTFAKSFATHSEMLEIKSAERINQKIVGGLNADQGEFPYQLSLRIDGFHFCGGSLIEVEGEQIALTAAHCVDQFNGIPEALSVIAGDVKISDITGYEQTSQVRRIVVHEKYGSSNNLRGLYNDIALIFLENPYELNEYVEVVNLPAVNEEPFGNLTISGWGTLYSGGEVSDTLQYVEMPIVSHSVCQEIWKHHPEYPMEIGNGILCSGVESGNMSACRGDSGGPAVSRVNGDLVGIVSFGDQYPGGLTNVVYYIGWIEEQVRNFI